MKLYLWLYNFSELWNLFSRVPIEDCKVLKIILVQGFCSLKSDIFRFLFGFRLNNFSLFLQEYKLLHPAVSKRERERQKRQKKQEMLLEQFDEVEVNRKNFNDAVFGRF